MSQSLKRNCLLRLLFSMTSSSVMVISPIDPLDTPISAKFFANSQPSAPAPTRNTLRSSSFLCTVLPNTPICPSYRLPYKQPHFGLAR